MVGGEGEGCEFIRWYREIEWCLRNILQTFQGIADLSPYNINALENRVVKRNEYMIREDKSYWYFNIQILLTTCIEKL